MTHALRAPVPPQVHFALLEGKVTLDKRDTDSSRVLMDPAQSTDGTRFHEIGEFPKGHRHIGRGTHFQPELDVRGTNKPR